MVARIYRPSKTAMQSGQARAKDWVLEHEQTSAREIDPLMGWTSSGDTQQQVRLRFETKEEAIAYAERNGLPHTVTEPTEKTVSTKSYADNFRFGRIGSWTH
jgi:ETC complex I subunit conserved region